MTKIKDLKSGFLGSLSVLTSGSLLSQLILAMEQVALARIFTPASLGIFSFLMSVPMACVGVICGRYDLTIVYENDESKVLPLVKLNICVNLMLSLFITLGYSGFIFAFKGDYIQYLYLMPAIFIYLVAYGLTNTLNAYNNRYQDYIMITKMYVFRTLAQCLGTVLLGLIFITIMKKEYLSIPILVIPYCLGMFCGVFTQAKMLRNHRKEILQIPLKELWQVAKLHKKQPLLSAPAIFANGFSYSLVTMFTENLYGKAVTGYYSISAKILGMPIALISGNLSKVYMEEASKEYNSTGSYRKALIKTFKFLIVLAVPMFLCMYLLAPPVCGFLFGKDWMVAGDYIKILAVMFTFRFVATAISPGLYVCRKQQTELFIQVLLLVATAIAGVVSYRMQSTVEEYLWLISLSRSAVMLLHILVVFYYSGVGLKNMDLD